MFMTPCKWRKKVLNNFQFLSHNYEKCEKLFNLLCGIVYKYLRLKKEKNNYLLSGKKCHFFTEINSRYFILFIYTNNVPELIEVKK